MGKHFGNLKRITGINYYVLSPYEQNPFKGMLKPGLENTLRRFRESFLIVTLPIATFLTIRHICNDIYDKSIRKNPDDYKNDV